MKNLIKSVSHQTMLGLILLCSAPSFANDQTASQSETSATKSADGGFLKVGLGYKHEMSPYEERVQGLSLFVNGRYQWNGLFVEAFYGANERNEGLSFGYNFYNSEHWNFDINTVKAHGEIRVNIHDEDKMLIQQYDKTEMIGLRATGHYGQTTVQFLVAPYSFNDNYDDGIYASMWLGKSWQLKNWELRSSIGLEYRSEEITEHYYSISAEQATKHFVEFDPDAGIDVTAQVSLSYPISRHVLFESYLRHTNYSSAVENNPVLAYASQLDSRADKKTEFGLLLSYVF